MNTKMKHLTPPRLFALFCAAVLTISTYAQSITVTGVVMAEGEPDPVIGANVMVKGTSNGTITDFDGNFSLEAKSGDILLISYMGYKSQEVKASASPMRITLQADNVLLEEVVAIGYGTMKKSDLTAAVTSVSAEDLLRAPVSGLDQALQGRAAGVTVTTNSGQPGEAATIRIRGIGSAMGGNEPLYVVDGVITGDISFVAPSDIASMEILKDASAAAIYGSRGANGVILITTKGGGQGKVNVSFDAYWGFQNRWKKLDVMNAQNQVETELRIGAMRNGAEEIGYYQNNGFAEWLKMYKLGKSEFYPTNFDYASQETDWQDEVFVPNAFMHNYNLSVDGGTEKIHYALSTSYFSQDGTIIGSNYDRFTLRLNTDFEIAKWLKVGEHLSLMVSGGRNAMNNSSSAGASIISGALSMSQWDPVYYPDGSENKYTGKDLSGRYSAGSNFKNVTNPYQMAFNSEPKNKNHRLVGDVYLEIMPLKGLTIRPSISVDYALNSNRSFMGPNTYTSYNYSEKNFISSSMEKYQTLLEELTITYARTIEKHNFSVMVGQTWSEYNYYSLGGSGANILNPAENNWYLNSATEDKNFSDGVGRERRLSFLARAYYGYDNRYMATVNFRADASSKFTKQPWGFFPSLSLAWRLSEEPFLRDLELSWLDNIKIRAGYGQVGNDGVPSSVFVQVMESGNKVFYGYPLGVTTSDDNIAYGSALLTLANQDGKWETNEQWDAGIDFGFWNGRLSGSVDYFRRNTLDALLYVNTPAHVGNWGSPVKNVGNIRNEGVEITLNHDNTVGKVHYNIGANISYLKNTLTKLNGGSPLWGDRTKTDEGMALNSFWGYRYEGVYVSDEEVLEHLYSYKDHPEECGIHAGDAKYYDKNGDGKIDEDDKMNLGNAFPKVTYGINLGADFYGVDIQLFFQGVAGNKIYNAQRQSLEGDGTSHALASYMADEVWIGYTDVVRDALLDAGVNWMELENRKGTIPNPLGSPTNTENSTRFLESGAYFRLKNAQIGYTLPKHLTQKFHCSRLRFYVTASNLFTITNYTGYDPEVGGGVDYGNYPQSRTFTFGLNANF